MVHSLHIPDVVPEGDAHLTKYAGHVLLERTGIMRVKAAPVREAVIEILGRLIEHADVRVQQSCCLLSDMPWHSCRGTMCSAELWLHQTRAEA